MVIVTSQLGQRKLSQISIDTDLEMGAYAITINAGGLIDGKDVSTMIFNLSELNIDADLNMETYKILMNHMLIENGRIHVNVWNVTAAVYLHEISVAAKELEPKGLYFKPDGTKMYITGAAGDSVDEYDLGTPWNVTTAVYLHEISIAAKETYPTGIFFKPDGAKMYITGNIGVSVDEYDLSTPWDVTTAVYLHEISVAAKESSINGMFFKPDGTKMYTVGVDGDSVDEYDLSTPWNVTAAVYLHEISVAAKETAPSGVFFKTDGTKMYILGGTGDSVDEYDLSTPWDVTTAVYLHEISIAAKETAPGGMFFKSDGTKMYIVGATGDSVDEYDLGVELT